jgi:hypothetical protein
MMPGIQDMLENVCKSKGLNFEEYCESPLLRAFNVLFGVFL